MAAPKIQRFNDTHAQPVEKFNNNNKSCCKTCNQKTKQKLNNNNNKDTFLL